MDSSDKLSQLRIDRSEPPPPSGGRTYLIAGIVAALALGGGAWMMLGRGPTWVVSTAMAQPVTRTDDFVAADTGQPAAMTNWAVLLRPPGPATPIPDVEGFVVTEAVDGPSLEVVERVLIEGFPLPELLPVVPRRAFDARVLGGPTRFFLGWHRDEPVATASVTVAHGVG